MRPAGGPWVGIGVSITSSDHADDMQSISRGITSQTDRCTVGKCGIKHYLRKLQNNGGS